MAQTSLNQLASLDPLFQELGLAKLAPEERKEVEERMVDHFTKVVLETVIVNLSDGQAKEFKAAIDDGGDALEDRIALICAHVPGLAQKIDAAVKDEVAVLKAAMTAA